MQNQATGYRIPKQVEQYGAEAVPADQKRDKWYHLLQIMLSSMLNPAFYILPGIAITQMGFSFWTTIFATVVATAIGMITICAGATIGTDYGLPGQVAARSSFGLVGSRVLVSSLRGVSSIYWFAFQVLGAAFGIQVILKGWLGWEISVLVLSSALALLQVVLGAIGFHALRSASRMVWPVALAMCAMVVYLFVISDDPNHWFSTIQGLPGKQEGWLPFAVWVSMIFGMWVPMCTSSADMCRYARSRRDVWVGIFFGGVLGKSVATFAGAYAASATGDWNPFSAATQLTTNPIIPLGLILGLFVNVLSINILNIYTAGMAVVNIVPRLGRFWSTSATGVVAFVVCLLPTIVNDAQIWVREIGSVFGPLSGVFLADYFIVRRSTIDVGALFDPAGEYGYFHGINPLAIVALAGGYLGFRVLPMWSMPSLSSFVISGALYVVITSLFAPGRLLKRER